MNYISNIWLKIHYHMNFQPKLIEINVCFANVIEPDLSDYASGGEPIRVARVDAVADTARRADNPRTIRMASARRAQPYALSRTVILNSISYHLRISTILSERRRSPCHLLPICPSISFTRHLRIHIDLL